MLHRLAYRINATLENWLPEQRLFLKSDEGTRFIRLRPMTQAVALTTGGLLMAWTFIATSIILMDSISAGSDADQAAMQQQLFEQRLTALSTDRDLRAEEASRAQDRFNLALAEVSEMQARLLASEDRRKELETGIDVIQNTLRRAILERDESRAALERTTTALASQSGTTELGRARDALATIGFMSGALGQTARERDEMSKMAEVAREDAAAIQRAKDEMALRNDAIFARLEEAVTVSMEPLDKMFRAAGMSPDSLLDQVRKGYSGQGGPLMPIVSTKGGALSEDEARANTVLQGLDRMNMYRLAAVKAPFANPIPSGNYRFTSGFGSRNDPFGRGTRRHEGLDFAGAYGTPLYATADGVVVKAGWGNGYGRMVQIRHDFGLETLYGHMSEIRVSVGQKVSRGDRIGDMGNSGRSTGTHLHYEVHVGGRPVNPMTFIKAASDVF
ncbi:MAG: peptidoglycan DD-metalloendopeptidase family protein [Gemmobacter sp.]|uniref:M23 family metallopeptidase n=1 Tax=Gemmobacter sp. TaxID=1898957 RepID=UPI001A4F4B79|nr:M23 family metallopeptidase [Gemmobacter sp.]MBL8562145.1 peptidoglycan DD-metalloendopeptidase family protein [Gemmobacter sp.]